MLDWLWRKAVRLENIIRWSNSKLFWKKKDQWYTLDVKKVETNTIYFKIAIGKIIIVESQARKSLEIRLKQISVVTHLEDDQEKLNKSFAFFLCW